MSSKWRRIAEKCAVEKEEELRLVALQELSEKARHCANIVLGLLGLYLAVVSLGLNNTWTHVSFAATILVAFYKYFKWRKLLEFVEDIVAGDPPVKLIEKLKEHEDMVTDIAIMVLLYITALLIVFFR
ncbi:MAG: hypothetical protein DRN04_17930 [Thermoprotei archaeon]|nr:MAG: hypothetical protein DRN04_17930 [Thermoprotei archaeon]